MTVCARMTFCGGDDDDDSIYDFASDNDAGGSDDSLDNGDCDHDHCIWSLFFLK